MAISPCNNLNVKTLRTSQLATAGAVSGSDYIQFSQLEDGVYYSRKAEFSTVRNYILNSNSNNQYYVPVWNISGGFNTGSIYDYNSNVGIGTTVPYSTLDVNGSFSGDTETFNTSGTHSLDETNFIVLADANTAGGNIIFTLPTAASSIDRVYIIKKTDTSVYTVELYPNGSDTIDGTSGSPAYTIAGGSRGKVIIVSDGSNWHIISD
jgi:hypothetical protein